MVRGGPQLRTSSPRPLILQNHSKWKNDESSSISSADSALDELTSHIDHRRNHKWEWLRKEAKSFVDDVINAFETGTPGEQTTQQETEKLSAVQLRKDIKRFYSAVHPYLEVFSALYDIIMWKNPLSTLLLILVIIYSLYRGWLATLLLGLLIFQLSINYLSSVKNIDLGWMFLPRKQVIMPKFDISGAQLIFDIAKLAQKLLRFGTNILEKIESLFLWKNEKVTRVFFILSFYWLLWSLFFTAGTCIGWTVLAIGIRIFFTTYLFQRFPKLKTRFDTYGYFYRNLPIRSAITPRSQPVSGRSDRITMTNVAAHHHDLEERCPTPSSRSLQAYCGEKFESRLGSNFNLDQSAAVNLLLGPNHRNPVPHLPTHYDSHPHLDTLLDSPPLTAHSELSATVSLGGLTVAPSTPHEFGGPSTSRHPSKSSSVEEHDEDENEHTSECADPIIDNVIAFRSCVMNEKERLFPMGITPGILYLTDAALVFRPRNQSDEQLMMLFHDLKLVKKTQSLRSMSLITGTRKSLDIHMEGRRKPVQFIGLAKRDDFVTRIQLMCRNAGANVDFAE
ncbi:hypothetical protein GCK72_015529 [Caenorhabditis remanei]|uniref:GRAM domain-containing protein n=1 Tax=Caenorhabditis remanei TaxID=31234 RepID=A0A6A5GWY8_CAERE|nr:hypothetical protein GCK72_015529 [Caenorhabditis remanei]KAF1759069.1 hypothetical protein GCK72_015529 [Caenorhabditis remanei]